ncbi:16379_t:CDS:2, partial [Funneliformis geosporum]
TTVPSNEGAMDIREQDNGKPEDDDNYGKMTHIKKKEISLIVDFKSYGYIISLKLLKELDMEIDKASKTIM